MYSDSLYRVSFKCVVLGDDKKILAVREHGRSSWDIPGGGIEYGETIDESIKRELFEEVGYENAFTYTVLTIHDPVKLLTRDVWQIKVVILLSPENYTFKVGAEADDVAFIDPVQFLDSEHESERRMIDYVRLASGTDVDS